MKLGSQLKVSVDKKMEYKMRSIWKTNETFKRAVRIILEEKKKDVSFQFIWEEIYEAAKVKEVKVSDDNSKKKVQEITFADFLKEPLNSKKSNHKNKLCKNDIRQDKKIKIAYNVNVGKAKVMSSTKVIVNDNTSLTSNENKQINSCKLDFQSSKKLSADDFNHAMQNEDKIEITKMRKIAIGGKGECLFRSFSYANFGTEEHHEKIRKEVVQFVDDNWDDYNEMCNNVHSQFTQETGVSYFHSGAEYVEFMGQNKTYGTEFEISVLSALYGIRIIIFLNENSFYKVMETFNLDNSDECVMILFSGNRDGGHFEVLQFNEKIIPKKDMKNLKNKIFEKQVHLNRCNYKNCSETMINVENDNVLKSNVDKSDKIFEVNDYNNTIRNVENQSVIILKSNESYKVVEGKQNNENIKSFKNQSVIEDATIESSKSESEVNLNLRKSDVSTNSADNNDRNGNVKNQITVHVNDNASNKVVVSKDFNENIKNVENQSVLNSKDNESDTIVNIEDATIKNSESDSMVNLSVCNSDVFINTANNNDKTRNVKNQLTVNVNDIASYNT